MGEETQRPRLIAIPHMHRALAAADTPAGVFFLDPGLAADAGDGPYHTPAGLPLSPAQGKALLRDMLLFGERFPHPGDIASHAGRSEEDFREDTPSGRRSEKAAIEAFAASGEPPTAGRQTGPDDDDTAAGRKAQLLLLLAFSLEERLIELRALRSRFQAGSKRFQETLGLDEDNETHETALHGSLFAAEAGFEDESPALPLTRILESQLFFLPAGTTLFTREEALVRAWKEAGLLFRSLEQEEVDRLPLSWTGAPPLRLEACTASAAALALSGRIPAEKPWLAREYQVLYWPPDHAAAQESPEEAS